MKKADALERIERQIRQIDEVSKARRHSPEFTKWKRDTEVMLGYVFGNNSRHVVEFSNIRYTLSAYTLGSPDSIFEKRFQEGLADARKILESMRDEVKEYFSEPNNAAVGLSADQLHDSSTVFIIHGHNLDFAEAVARFVEKRGLAAIILHEHPNRGRTIIEKFEQHAQPCAFAIALFGPDDEARLRETTDELKPRARQNVVLELGYFVGALGRKRVAVLHDADVELPSDFDGVLYIPIDNRWRDKLGQELDAAGLKDAAKTSGGTS